MNNTQDMVLSARELILLDEDIKKQEHILEELKNRRNSINRQLVSLMVDEEMQRFTLLGKTLYLNTRTSASPVSGIRDRLFKALEENGYADIVKPNVNANTLSAIVRELMEQNGGELPAWLSDYVNLYTETKVGIRKA